MDMRKRIAMSIAARQTRSPRPHDPDRGADALGHFPDARGGIADLIRGTAGCSPYLAGLLAREAGWLWPALDAPEDAVARTCAALADLPLTVLSVQLRQAKRRIALLVALADLAGAWPLQTVTASLSALADAATAAALRALVAAEIGRGGLPGQGPDDAIIAAGMVILAMGKWGADELNYSSDIDLICLFDETRYSRADFPLARAAFVKITRRMTALLADITDQGYVFRTDLRLRPDASISPVCIAMAGAEAYYEAQGRTWERAAYIKARAAAGDITAGERFLATLRPFVWRKHLDFAAIQDAHDMRLRIRNHKGLHGPLVLPFHDMKLGRGGIREIEFFTQTRQLIAGGRDTSLRVRGTVAGLDRLAAAGWVPPDIAAKLSDHYRAHRLVEHRLQMLNDAQTHALPGSDDGFARLAAFMDIDPAALGADLTARLTEVHDLTDGFFAPGPAAPLADSDFGAAVAARWPHYPALRSTRAVEIFRRLKPDILRRLSGAARPDEALGEFDTFLAGLPAGVQLFSLFEANPHLTGLVVDICATAPALARYLSRNAGVFDAVIGGAFFADWPGVAGLDVTLQAALAPVSGYEARLDAVRRWMKEWHFRIGVHHLRGLTDADIAGGEYADLAHAVLAGLWPDVVAEFARKHGPLPGQGAVVLGMGSLGAGRLHATSDLDLIVIYDAAGDDASVGPRPLPSRSYYARLTQALVTAITAPTAQGRLYDVDMRLRPSGRQGPVATGFAAFCAYQQDQAWTWEHLALTRARTVAGAARLAGRVEAFRVGLLADKAAGATVRGDVAQMRARIAAAKGQGGPFDAKFGPGRLMEIELAAQMLALQAGSPARSLTDQIAAGVACGLLPVAGEGALRAAQALFWQVQAAARLLMGGPLEPDRLGEGGRRLILRETGQPDMAALEQAMAAAAVAAGQVIDRLLEGEG